MPAAELPGGFPAGRALCPECGGFVPLQGDRLAAHDAYRGTEDPAEAADRAAWFNAFGWES